MIGFGRKKQIARSIDLKLEQKFDTDDRGGGQGKRRSGCFMQNSHSSDVVSL